MKLINLKINYFPHSGQAEVLDAIMHSQADVITLICSRGWGKTLFAVNSIVIPPTIKYPNFQTCWIAPNYKIAAAPIDDVFFGIDELTGERYINDVDAETNFRFFEHKRGINEIHFWNNSKMILRSADAPDSIVSKGYNLIVIDEAALISKDVFQTQILPIARKQNCKIVLITTPRGKNWVYHMYLDGLDPAKVRYFAVKQPYWKRPNYPPLLLDLMKDLPAHIRKQEFEAEFLDNSGGTFTNLEKIFSGEQIEFESDQQEWKHPEWESLIKDGCVIAVDFAKSVDYTVISILNSNKKLVYYYRLNKTDYKVVLNHILEIAKEFNYPDVIYDATGVGSGISDFLSTDLNVFPFVFTNQTKNDLINKLIIATEYTAIEMPNILTIKNEFEIFEFKMTKTGKISYSAPDGKHDDCVFSIAMANWYLEENSMKGEVHSVDNFLQIVSEHRSKSVYDEIENDND